MTTVDALIILVAFLMLALAGELERAERLAEENRRLRARPEVERDPFVEAPMKFVDVVAPGRVVFPARWADGSGA